MRSIHAGEVSKSALFEVPCRPLSIMPLDEIGDWSETKFAIIREYATAYTQIVSAQKKYFHYVYVDVFAGSGLDKSRKTGEIVRGSPTIALQTKHRFEEYFSIDLCVGTP